MQVGEDFRPVSEEEGGEGIGIGMACLGVESYLVFESEIVHPVNVHSWNSRKVRVGLDAWHWECKLN